MRNLLLLIAVIFSVYTTSHAGLRVAVSKVSITPATSQTLIGYAPRKSQGVRDSIYHKVLLIDDGKRQFFLVSTDLAAIAPPTYERAARRLQKELGIRRDQFWWTNTHTHSAPEVGSSGVISLFLGERYKESYDQTYTDFVEDKLVEAVVAARKGLKPARMGVGWGYSRANVNRRARDIDNKTFLGENPDAPIDHKLGLLRFESEDGKPVAFVANYPIHGTVLASSDLRISGDVPGVVAEYVEKQTGAPLLFINGALGNVAPRFSVSVAQQEKKDGQLKQFRKLLGEPILEANRKIMGTTGDVTINISSIIIETPKRAGLKGWPSDMKEYLRTTAAGEELIRMPVQFLQINDDIVLWGAPCELFCEVSNEVRGNSPFPYTFYSGLTNGTLGYLCTAEEIALGGYEPGVSPFSPQAARDVADNVSRHLEQLSRQKKP